MNEHPWLDRNEYPFTSHYFPVNENRMHYIDEGAGDVILFIHGTPSWSFDFRHQVKALSKKFRCIAIDHIGFGLSDKPSLYDYSTQKHVNILSMLIDHLNLSNVTMVVHDFGGPIGFAAAARNPSIVKQFVVLNSWAWSTKDEPSYKKMKGILKSPLLPFLYKYLNFSVNYLLPRSFSRKNKLSKHILSQYRGPFSSPGKRQGTIAFAKSLLNDQDWFESVWDQMDRLKTKRSLFIWGMDDPFITPAYLEKYLAAFSNHTVVKLEDCGHFPQEEKHKEVTEAIEQFLG